MRTGLTGAEAGVKTSLLVAALVLAAPAPPALGQGMQERLAAAAEDGLDPARYDVSRLGLTAASVLYLRDLRDGRAPDRPASTAGFRRETWDAEAALARAVAGDTVDRLIEAVRPPFRQYRRLQAALAKYRALGALEAPVLPAGIVRPGERLDSAAALGRWLVALGDLDQLAGDSVYGDALAAGVRRFQVRHALTPDAIIGPGTRAAMRVPIAARVRQIELAMERLRWLPRIAGERLIVVNVPAFELFAFDTAGGAGEPALEIRVIVGGAGARRTPPVFERIRYVEFNPYWNVPSSILRGEILPKVRRDPGYLRASNMEIVGAGDRVLGDSPTPELLAALAAGRARVRQRPGADNALGPVKLIFPNRHDVYLHGTPAPELFDASRRDLSHGCIRVEDPAALTAWVLRREPGWDRDAVEQAMAPGPTRRVPVREAPAVFIYYTTAIVRGDGSVYFYPDVYGRDRQLAADPRMTFSE
jgi:murein L,D-transpeptidase YcbB/YkuD